MDAPKYKFIKKTGSETPQQEAARLENNRQYDAEQKERKKIRGMEFRTQIYETMERRSGLDRSQQVI